MILSVDTSQPILSLALLENDGRRIASFEVDSEGSRNEKLLPLVDLALAESGRPLREVELFVVTRGPGSFTGTRIGLAMIQGMSLGVNRPFCAMSTHEAAAWLHSDRRVMVASDAGRGESYVSGWADGARVLEEQLMKNDALPAAAAEFDLLLTLEEPLPDGVSVALLAAQKGAILRERNRLDGYGDATPLYVRLAEAEMRLQVTP